MENKCHLQSARMRPLMMVIRSKSFTGSHAWQALSIATMNGIGTRLHWTDQPYQWHTNDGQEVFVVLDGQVLMHYRENGEEHSTLLEAGDIFQVDEGNEHMAHPQGVARVLVIETVGSV